ncbi:hypothetical protein PV325_007985 [Microctonus aethiopoides]|nr:hypothetical protein PV325_007985 [Microctonus aethiopoides]
MSLRMDFGGYKGTAPRVRVRRRAELGRRLTRRLSMVAKVPAAILQRTNQPDPKPIEITAIGPDKTQLTINVPLACDHGYKAKDSHYLSA